MQGIAWLLMLLTNAGGPGAGWSEVEFITSAPTLATWRDLALRTRA